jgi:predicted nucleic acid-binding protein
MKYVFDSDSLIDLFRHYYPERFPTLWKQFEVLVSGEKLISVREVFNEIGSSEDRLGKWVKEKKRTLFLKPTVEEFQFVGRIFRAKRGHFQAMIRKQERLKGKPVADPFVIARAKALSAYVVTQEKKTDNAAKVPNVCEHFEIPCDNLEGFMKKENWKF